MKKMCLKFISELFKMDLMIFTEEFCAMLLYNEDFIKSMIAISIEIILFVEDIQEISFHKIPELFGVDLYDLWKVIKR
jgi:predicted HTH domain antitoxin